MVYRSGDQSGTAPRGRELTKGMGRGRSASTRLDDGPGPNSGDESLTLYMRG